MKTLIIFEPRRTTGALLILVVLLVGAGLDWSAGSHARSGSTIRGRILEACSCMVPCPCNFGRNPAPHDPCDSLAFFLFEEGEVDRVELKGLHFAMVARGGRQGTVYVGTPLSEQQFKVLTKIAEWILGLEGTPLIKTQKAPMSINFDNAIMSGTVDNGTGTRLTGVRLVGSDGKSTIVMSHPMIFGTFPVISAQKGAASKLIVRSDYISFEYQDTNLNNGVFEFSESEVKIAE